MYRALCIILLTMHALYVIQSNHVYVKSLTCISLYVWIFAVACILAATHLQISSEADYTFLNWFTPTGAASTSLRTTSKGRKDNIHTCIYTREVNIL